MHFFGRLRLAFWRAFQHGQFSVAKAAAYSSILTLFPAFLRVTSILEASHATAGFLHQISEAWGWVRPPGANDSALPFFQSKHHHTTRMLGAAATVTLSAPTGHMISLHERLRTAAGST